MSDDSRYAEWPEEPAPERRRFAVVRVLAVILVVAASFAGLYVLARSLAGAAGPGDGGTVAPGVEVEVTIPDGASARRIGEILAEAGVVAAASSFEREVRSRGVASLLRAGEYDLVTAMDTDVLFTALLTGPAPAETYRLTLIEGLRIEEVLASLAAQSSYPVSSFETALLDGTIASAYLPEDVAGLQAWEGLLFPDTYEFVIGATPETILTRLARTLEGRVDELDWNDTAARGLSVYEGMIVASLIEKEAKLDEERPLIASVIYNRLDRGIALQIDATVIYALGENPGRVTLADLEIDSPYNTYRNPGLPPTPIGGVRLASLAAAAIPAETDYLYYVLIDPSGEHGFTSSYDEFLRLKEQGRRAGALP